MWTHISPESLWNFPKAALLVSGGAGIQTLLWVPESWQLDRLEEPSSSPRCVMLSDSSSNQLRDYHLALEIFGGGCDLTPQLDSQCLDFRFSVLGCVSSVWPMAMSPCMCAICLLPDLSFFEPLRNPCHCHFLKLCLTERPFHIRSRLRLPWVQASTGDTCFKLQSVLCVACTLSLTLPEWVLVEDALPDSSGPFSLFRLCCYFIFLKAWFSPALLGYNPRFVAQLHLGRGHTHWNWEKIDSYSPRKLP